VPSLTEAEASRRLAQYGLNRLQPAMPLSAWRILGHQFRGVVVLLLVAAVVLSLFLGDRMEAMAIGAVLCVNAVIGFSTELRARRTMEADAPALRQADVGVAMGIRGTDVAKEAAAIVLQDDRFETIAAAVEEGRVIVDNIRKFVFYLFSCNFAEVLLLFVAGLTGLPVPLLPLQILWLNLVTDTFPALALALEPGDSNVMNRPPRNPHEALLSRGSLLRIACYGLLITASTLAAYVWTLDAPEAKSRTVAFMTLALAQILHLGNARSKDAVLLPAGAIANPLAVAAVALSGALQLLAATYDPLVSLLRLTELEPSDWVIVAAAAGTPAVVGQMFKTVTARRRTQARSLLERG
jgi:Ca2+-transporting ATPase